MTAGPTLDAFNTALDTASGNIGEVQDAVTSAREGAEDIRWAIGTFGRIENKADEVAKILGGFGDVLDLLGKVGPLRTVFNPLKRFQRSLNQRGFTAGCFSDSSCSGGSDHAQPAFCRYSSPF